MVVSGQGFDWLTAGGKLPVRAGRDRPDACWERVLADFCAVVVTIAVFAVLALIVKGVDKL